MPFGKTQTSDWRKPTCTRLVLLVLAGLLAITVLDSALHSLAGS